MHSFCHSGTDLHSAGERGCSLDFMKCILSSWVLWEGREEEGRVAIAELCTGCVKISPRLMLAVPGRQVLLYFVESIR